MNLLERLDHLIKTLGISERELARRAGLTDSHIGLLRTRLRSDPGAVTLKTLEAIAKAAGVSVAWLVAGEDERQAGGSVPPAKAAAAELARAQDVWEVAVQSVLAEPPPDEQRSVDWWLLRMKMREIELLEEAGRRQTTRKPSEQTGVICKPRAKRAS